jgi:DNA-binding GntR family transcriptional regulator
VLIEMLNGLREQTALISVNAWTQRPSWEHEATEHAQILAAARAGDSGRAAELTLEHIETFRNRAIHQIGGDH